MSEVDLQGIAENLGNQWLWVGRLLSLDDSLLERIKEENPRNMSECSYQMLDAWTKKYGVNATYNWLALVLLHIVVQLRSVLCPAGGHNKIELVKIPPFCVLGVNYGL